MLQANSAKLDRKVREHCERIRNAVVRKLKLDIKVILKHKEHKQFFPAMSSGCRRDSQHEYIDDSGEYSRTSYVASILNKQNEVRAMLKGLQQCPQNIHDCGNEPGRCAEQHTANKLLLKAPTFPLTEIRFSTAMRPRTLQEFEACAICRYIFS